MSTAENKALILAHYEELVNEKNLAAADSQVAPDYVDHAAPPGTPRGPGMAKHAVGLLHAGLPDVHITVDDIVAEGDRVAVRATWRGTHTGVLFGVPPTGKEITISGLVMWRIADGRIAERWDGVDRLALFQQLGLASPGAAKD